MAKKSNPKGSSINDFFDTTIPENVRSRMKWKDEVVANKPQMVSAPNKVQDKQETVTIPVVELFDNDGGKVVFELLDTIECDGDRYTMLTPYWETEDEYALNVPADVFIMREVMNKYTNEPLLETVEDEPFLKKLYEIFKQKRGDEYEFRD